MKRRLVISMLFVVALAFTGCRKEAANTAATTTAPTAEPTVNSEDTSKEDTASAGGQASEEQTFAKELLTRHVTSTDVITEEVINSVIEELKSEYQFEKLDDFKIASSEWVYVADGKGWLDQLFADNKTGVTVVEGTIGNEAQLMERGELHVSSRMLYPYLLYKSQGAQISAIQLSEDPAAQIVTVLVDANSDLDSLEDLAGKKIGSWNAGCQYVALLEQTENLGWKEGQDWTYVNVAQDGLKTALLAGELDAISVHPLTSFNSSIIDGSLKEIGNALEDGTYQNCGGATVYFAPTEFANSNTNILKAFLKLREVVSAYVLTNEEDAAAVVEGITRTPAENTIFWWERSKDTFFSTNDTLDHIKTETGEYQNWLVEHGIITSEKATSAEEFYLSPYFE